MGVEFVILQNKEHFAESQVLPEVYTSESYNGKSDIYIISADGYRFRVDLVKPTFGLWFITGPKWTAFCNRYLHKDVELLHFVEEGDECFYVTRYFPNGYEVGGYDVNRATYSRFKTFVLPDPGLTQSITAQLLTGFEELDQLTIKVNGQNFKVHVHCVEVLSKPGTYVYNLLGNVWSSLVNDVGLEPGTTCVFTKNRGHTVWLDAFDNEGGILTQSVFKGACTLRKNQLPLEWNEQNDDRMKHICYWAFHTDHYGEYNRSFYKSYAQIQCRNRLAIPAHFLKKHPMHHYNKALVVHQNYRDVMRVQMESHKERPERTNDVNMFGQWKLLAEACHFPYAKVIRFKYVSNGVDLDVAEGENPYYPIFHIC